MLSEKTARIKEAFQEKIALYGLSATMMMALKAILLKLFKIDWRKCYLMSRTLDDVCPPPARSDIEVRELTLSDYDNKRWCDFLTEEKRAIYETRFKNNKAKAYGAFVGEELAYSTWILYGEVIYSETEILLEQDDCALLLDTYCHPQYRGCGIHNYMNQWRLYKMKEYGTKKAYVIVLSHNYPAIKTQKKCGLEVEHTFYAWRLGKRKYITFRNKGKKNG